jgi:hypothetical protein
VVVVAGTCVPAAAEAAGPTAADLGWDRRIAPLAREVENLRGLRFEHAVPVTFLPARRFEKRVTTEDADLTKRDRLDIAAVNAELRALGLAGPATDAFATGNARSSSGILAYYDSDSKRIYVRGKQLDVNGRATVVHELTHALQDQRFDLNRMDDRARTQGAMDVNTALTEGDAVRIETDYVDTLSPREQDEYYNSEGPEEAEATAAVDLNGALAASQDAPYALGPSMVMALKASGGRKRIDRAFRTPPTTQLQFLNPVRALRPVKPRPVTLPARPADARRLFSGDTPTDFGAFDLYLMLAARIDVDRALDAADAWEGGRLSAYEQAGARCFDVAFAASGPGRARLVGGLADWAARMPAGAVTLTADGLGFHVCDPGDAAVAPPASAEDALSEAANRNDGMAEVLDAGAPPKVAECVATRMSRLPEFDRMVAADEEGREPSVTEQQAFTDRLDTLADECMADTTIR